jgi:hypothetical protein
MVELRFGWDPRKARVNLQKHGVSFEEAESAFYDERGLLLDDREHSSHEDRFVLLGLSSRLRILVVCHCVREGGHLVRIISARRASRLEESQYWERLER